jgi:hypothetical protein
VEAAVLVPLDGAAALGAAATAAVGTPAGTPGSAPGRAFDRTFHYAFDAAAQSVADDAVDTEALALARALEDAGGWTEEIVALALADLGDIRLPEPRVPPRETAVLASLPVLYWVHGLDQAGVLHAADTVAGLWASGAVNASLPDRGATLQQYWRGRRERPTAEERAHLLGLVFDARDFEPAMRRLCQTLVALADNAGTQDLREEVGVQMAATALLELCAARLEGAPLAAAPELLAHARMALQLLASRPLQAAFAVRDFYALVDLRQRGSSRPAARALAERAQAGAAVLRWLALSAAGGFRIDRVAPAQQTLIAHAQRWLMVPTPPPRGNDAGAA